MTPDQQQALQELSTKYLGTEVGTLLLRAFPQAGLQPGPAPQEQPNRAASEGTTARRGENVAPKRKPTDRSRSPRDPLGKPDPNKRKHGDKTPDPTEEEDPMAEEGNI